MQFFNILSFSRVFPGGRYVPQKTASQFYFRFRLRSAPNRTRLKSMGQTSICPSESIAIFQHLSAARLLSCGRHVPQKTASQYYFRFRLGSAPNPTRLKSMGQTSICPSESIAIFQHFKRCPTCFMRAPCPTKNRVSILLPVLASERAKPDTA